MRSNDLAASQAEKGRQSPQSLRKHSKNRDGEAAHTHTHTLHALLDTAWTQVIVSITSVWNSGSTTVERGQLQRSGYHRITLYLFLLWWSMQKNVIWQIYLNKHFKKVQKCETHIKPIQWLSSLHRKMWPLFLVLTQTHRLSDDTLTCREIPGATGGVNNFSSRSSGVYWFRCVGVEESFSTEKR